MKEFWNVVWLAFTVLGKWINHFLGGCDGLLYALIVFVIIDYITGLMCVVVDRKLSNAIGFRGIFKKVIIFLLVGIGNIIDTQVIGNGSIFRTAVILFELSNEGLSLLENAAYIDVPIPEQLKEVFGRWLQK